MKISYEIIITKDLLNVVKKVFICAAATAFLVDFGIHMLAEQTDGGE